MVLGKVLRPEAQAPVAVLFRQFMEKHVGRKNEHVGAIGQVLHDIADELVGHGSRAVHLPVSGDQLLAHGLASRQWQRGGRIAAGP